MHINQGKHERPTGMMGDDQRLSLGKLKDTLFDISKDVFYKDIDINDRLDAAYFVGMLRCILDKNRVEFTDKYVGAIISMENLARKYAQTDKR